MKKLMEKLTKKWMKIVMVILIEEDVKKNMGMIMKKRSSVREIAFIDVEMHRGRS